MAVNNMARNQKHLIFWDLHSTVEKERKAETSA